MEGETGIKAKEKGETPSRLEVARPKSIRIGLAGSWGVATGCSPGLRETRKETGREGYRRRGYSLELATAKYDNILTALAPRIGSFSATGGPFQLQKKLLLRNEIIPQPLSIYSHEERKRKKKRKGDSSRLEIFYRWKILLFQKCSVTI